MYEKIALGFTAAERRVLLRATADDMLEPAGSLHASVPEPLRARFMAAVVRGMQHVPLPDSCFVSTDPAPPQ
jgi:hypothetical protein